MTHTCLRGEQLELVAARPPDDPLRREAEACARCRAGLMAFAAFIDPFDVPEEAGLEEADACLGAILEAGTAGRLKPHRPDGDGKLVEARPGPRAFPASPSPDRSTGRFATEGRWLDRFSLIFGRPALRPVWVVVIVFLAVWGGRESGWIHRPAGDAIDLRGESGAVGVSMETFEPSRSADGSVVVSWRAVPEADRYSIVLFDVALRETARIAAGGELSLRVDRGLLLPSAGTGPLFWSVIADRGGDEIARSEIRALPRMTTR